MLLLWFFTWLAHSWLLLIFQIRSNFTSSKRSSPIIPSKSGHACMCCAKLLSRVWLLVTPWTVGILCPWNCAGKNPGMGCHFLFQGTVLTQGSNPCLLYWQANSYHCATWETHDTEAPCLSLTSIALGLLVSIQIILFNKLLWPPQLITYICFLRTGIIINAFNPNKL